MCCSAVASVSWVKDQISDERTGESKFDNSHLGQQPLQLSSAMKVLESMKSQQYFILTMMTTHVTAPKLAVKTSYLTSLT